MTVQPGQIPPRLSNGDTLNPSLIASVANTGFEPAAALPATWLNEIQNENSQWIQYLFGQWTRVDGQIGASGSGLKITVDKNTDNAGNTGSLANVGTAGSNTYQYYVIGNRAHLQLVCNFDIVGTIYDIKFVIAAGALPLRGHVLTAGSFQLMVGTSQINTESGAVTSLGSEKWLIIAKPNFAAWIPGTGRYCYLACEYMMDVS